MNDIMDKSAFHSQMKIPTNKRVVTFFTQPNPSVPHSAFVRGDRTHLAINAVAQALRCLSDAHLIVKVHPYDEEMDVYRSAVKGLNASIVQGNEQYLKKYFDILSNSDVVIIVENSSVGLEALILNKPLIYLNFYETSYKMLYAGVAIAVTKTQDLLPAVQRSLKQSERTRPVDWQNEESVARAVKREDKDILKKRDFIHYWAGKIDGKATERIVELVERMAK